MPSFADREPTVALIDYGAGNLASVKKSLVVSGAEVVLATDERTILGADIRDLAAVSQTPPHHLLGHVANLSAEALAAAEAGLTRKVTERKHAFGESWEQTLRLAAYMMGDEEGAADFKAQVPKWIDNFLNKISGLLGNILTEKKKKVDIRKDTLLLSPISAQCDDGVWILFQSQKIYILLNTL